MVGVLGGGYAGEGVLVVEGALLSLAEEAAVGIHNVGLSVVPLPSGHKTPPLHPALVHNDVAVWTLRNIHMRIPLAMVVSCLPYSKETL